jgi:hypothetical protein
MSSNVISQDKYDKLKEMYGLEKPHIAILEEAYHTSDAKQFMELVFPKSWSSISARIIESGAEFSEDPVLWAPRWGKVPMTKKHGKNDLEKYTKSCIYRSHDLIHQLWGLPIPTDIWSFDDFSSYKRAQLCGEIAVLTLVEFALADHLAKSFPITRSFLRSRNALPLMDGPLDGKSMVQIAMRLDTLLHKKKEPYWVRSNEWAKLFIADYVPMLQYDRDNVDHNWRLMQDTGWLPPSFAPTVRYSSSLDGLELTIWMIEDFFHQMGTSAEVDEELAKFNRERRSRIVLPEGWNGYTPENAEYKPVFKT